MSNLKKPIAFFLSTLFFLFMVLPVFNVLAADATTGNDGRNTDYGLVPCGNKIENGKIMDPCDSNSVIKLIDNLMKFGFYLVSFVMVAVIAYGGFRYITSLGDPGKVKESWASFKSILIGVAWMLAAWLLVYTAWNFVTGDKGLKNIFFIS